MSGMLRFVVPAPSVAGLSASVVAASLAACAVSLVLVFLLPGGAESIDATLPGTGPLGRLIADIVPFVWVGLFGGLGAAYWLVAAGRDWPGRAGVAVLALVALCMIYPVVASGTAAPIWAILGNVITILAAIATALLCWPVSRWAAVFAGAVAVWVALATAGLVALALGLPF